VRVLDLYCCQGGASYGYERAGFEPTGVDIVDQPRYRHRFYRSDAVGFLRANREVIRKLFDFIHASPPCQLYSLTQRINGNYYPDLIAPTRSALEDSGLPWVIENVEDARSELHDPITLCGTMFGLRTYRHRLFEFGDCKVSPPDHPQHIARNAKMGRPAKSEEYLHIVGNFSGVQTARDIMDMQWANRDGLREAIPPVYAEYIGRYLIENGGV
jgi:DNA (cytosine-5)-methyltransferase 1